MQKILILGAKGMLGQELLKVFGASALGLDKNEIDVTDFAALPDKIKNLNPSCIINCVAFNDVDGAEDNAQTADLLNHQAPLKLSILANDLNIPLVHFSTNYVFDGQKGEYIESDVLSPLSIYAKSKAAGEKAVMESAKQFYVVRTAVLFGQKGESVASKKSFVELMLDLSQKTDTIKAVKDEVNSVTYAADLAHAVRVLLSQKFPFGIYHLVNLGEASWYELAKEIFSIKGLKINLQPVPSSEFKRKALRPKKSVLLNTKFIPLRSWQEALKEYLISNF